MQSQGQRFPSANRLRKPIEFSKVFNSPFRSSDRNFVVLAKPNNLSQARLGLAISKKRIQLATDRNRVKRLIRESFRRNQESLAGLDMVVMAQKKVAEKQNAEISDALYKHWQKLAQCIN